jgi:hypothetical protein
MMRYYDEIEKEEVLKWKIKNLLENIYIREEKNKD